MHYYLFLYTALNSNFQLINSNISNNTNLWIYCVDTKIDVINTYFSEITNTFQPFLDITYYSAPDARLNFINTSFE